MKRRMLTAAFVALLITSPIFAFANDPHSVWVGTWAVSPLSGTERGGPGTSFSQQTLRQILFASVGGPVARVQISNTFGTQPVTVSDVRIALPDPNSTTGGILTSTVQQLTFGGETSITIPSGALVLSDPVTFQVPPVSTVVVDMYFPGTTGPATQHTSGLQTNYIAQGDVSGQQSLAGAVTTSSYFFLTNLDVQAVTGPPLRGAVVTLGASITDGLHSTASANLRWPNDLARRLNAAGLLVGVLDQGISGNRLLTDITGPNAESRFDRDVVAQPGVGWVIFSDDPINDLGDAATDPAAMPTADQLIAGLKQLIARAHQKGLFYLCSTLTPYQGASYWTPAGEAVREQINAFILTPNNGCDAIVDQAKATANPAMPTEYLPAYDSGDHLHPNNAGYQAIANAVPIQVFFTGP